MADTTASGLFAQAEKMANLIASSSTFQGIVNATTMAEAKKHVYWPEAVEDENPVPRAVLSPDGMIEGEKAGTTYWDLRVGMCMTLEFLVPLDQSGIKNQYNWFMNKAGSVISDMQALAGTGEPITGETHIHFRRFERLDGPWFMLPEDMDLDNYDPDDMSLPRHWWMTFNMEVTG